MRGEIKLAGVEQTNNAWARFYRKGMIFALAGIFISLFFLSIGWFGLFNVFNDKPESWFQRSGSIMLVALAVSDCFIYKLNDDVGKLDMIPSHAIKTKDTYRPYVKMLTPVGVTLTLVATFITGYGELIFKLFF